MQVAAELCDDFPDGVFIVALAPINTPEQVVSAIAQTLGINESIGTPIPQVYRLDYEQVVAKARAQLADEDFGTAWDEGRRMRVEEAIATRRIQF